MRQSRFVSSAEGRLPRTMRPSPKRTPKCCVRRRHSDGQEVGQPSLSLLEQRGGAPVDADFAHRIRLFLEPYRLAGHDLEVNGPNYVALEIEMRVVARPDHFRSDIERALEAVFSAGYTPYGGRGVFFPDNFIFGQPVYLSPLYAVAQAVDGVASAQVTKFQRRGRSDPEALIKGRLDMARVEIARLDNDPNFPERGVFNAIVEGGK
jgi:hypothetical protein